MQQRGRLQPIVWAAVGLILIAAAILLILLNRPVERAYQDAILVYAGVGAL